MGAITTHCPLGVLAAARRRSIVIGPALITAAARMGHLLATNLGRDPTHACAEVGDAYVGAAPLAVVAKIASELVV